jgi:DNA-binding NarL/FixJ family response regulator
VTRTAATPTGAVLRVLLVDDHPVVRTGILGMLEPFSDIDVVGETGSGAKSVELAQSLRPHVVLMDLRLPDLDGVSATREILAVVATKVVIVTTYDTDADIVRAVAAGASGYLLKDCTAAELAAAIRSTAGGGTVLARRVDRRTTALTVREIEVLGRVAAGLSNSEIGQALYIGESTVKTHLLRIFTKLEVSDRTAAVITAVRLGVL